MPAAESHRCSAELTAGSMPLRTDFTWESAYSIRLGMAACPLCACGERHVFLLETLDGHGHAEEITLHFVATQQSELA